MMFTKEKLSYKVVLTGIEEYYKKEKEIKTSVADKWLQEHNMTYTYDEETETADCCDYYFENESDAIAFKLRWL